MWTAHAECPADGRTDRSLNRLRSLVETFDGSLRDECPNVHRFDACRGGPYITLESSPRLGRGWPRKVHLTIVVAAFIEGLVIVFRMSKEDVRKCSVRALCSRLPFSSCFDLELGALRVEMERQSDQKDKVEKVRASEAERTPGERL